MVTIVEATKILEEQEQEVSQVEQRLAEQREEFISLTRRKPLTLERQIRTGEIVGVGAVAQTIRETRQAKIEARQSFLPQFTEAEKQIIGFREQLAGQKELVTKAKIEESRRARFQDILSRIARGRPIPPGTTAQEVARAEEILKPFISRSVGDVQIAKLKTQGLIPVFKEQELVGFQDIIGKVDLPLEALGTIGEVRLESLEQKGIISFVKIEPKEITGFVTELEKPTGFFGLRRASFEIEKFVEEQRVKGEEAFLGEGGAFVLGAGLTLIQAPERFFQLGKGLVTDPVQTIVDIPGGITTSVAEIGVGLRSPTPGFAGGRLAGEVLILKGTGKLIQKAPIPKLKIRSLDIPTIKGDIGIKVFGLETKGGRGIVFGTKTPRGFEFGKGDIGLELQALKPGAEIKIGSVLETKLILEELTKAPEFVTLRGQQLIPIFEDILRETKGIESAFIKEPKLFEATERLPRTGVQTVLDIAKEEKGVLFGSKARAFQLAEEFEIGGEIFKLQKVPRDIELRFDQAGADLQAITEKTISRFRKQGTIIEEGRRFELGTAREIKGKPFTVEIKVDKTFVKAVELKGAETLLDQEFVPEFVIGFQKQGKPIKIGGIKATALEEELRGVSQGILRLRKEVDTGLLDISPPTKRLKDIGSVSVSARTLAESKAFDSSLLKRIEQFEELFPEKLVREQVSKALIDEKVALADFSPGKFKPQKDFFSSPSLVSPPSRVSISVSPISSPSVSSSALSPSVSPPSISPPSISPPSISPPSISPPSISPPSVSPSLSPSISPPSISPLSISPPSISPLTPTPPPIVFFPERKPKKKKKKKKIKKARAIIRPSLTGIILGIEAPAIESPRLGITPFQIRGLETGFNVPRRKRKVVKKKKASGKKKKAKRKTESRFSFTDL